MKKFISAVAVIFSLGSILVEAASLQILSAKVSDDGGIILKWQSESNSVYRIDYASELVNSNTPWQTLYDDYPSHGTNTFWMDNGDYSQEPPVMRPKDNPMRFYRISKTGTNTAAKPFVSVTFPATNAVVSGELIVSVTATSALPVLNHSLYVDGQEMPSSDDGTNYVINTSEWANGPHVIFATAKAASGLTGFPGHHAVTYGRAVSAYVPVIFSNYISQIYFSEPFFEPALSQTQRVTAVFQAYSTWTLQVLDESGSAVRTAVGQGRTMQFDWDGTGDGGLSIPDGVYEYQVTAEETPEPPQAPGGSGGGGGSEPPPGPGGASAMAADSDQPWRPHNAKEALMAGMTSYFVTSPPMPPVSKDGKWYSWEEVYGPTPPTEIQIPVSVQEAFLKSLTAEPANVTIGGALAAAAAAKTPKRPPVKPAKNAVATFGIAYWTFPIGLTNAAPPNGLGGQVALEGSTDAAIFDPVTDFAKAAQGFSKAMSGASWKLGFHKFNNNLQDFELIRNDLGYTGSNLFNRVNLGLFMSHGTFGTTLDFTPAAGQSKQTYFPAGGTNPPNSWIRLSEFRFGDNLRWMAVLACNSLQEDAYQSMYNKMVLPIGDQNQAWANQLHLLLGCRTYAAVSPNFGEVWAKKMNGGAFSAAQTVKDAWFNTGRQIYSGQPATNIFTNTLYFKAVGWDTTVDSDKLRQYTIPDPTVDLLEDRNQQVYP